MSTFCLIRKNLCFKPACSMPSWEKSCKIIIFSLRLYLILNQNFLGYNRWACGSCLERWWSHKQKSRVRRVTITSLWVATIRHHHTEKQWNNDTYLILTAEREGGQRVKLPSTIKTGQAHVRMSDLNSSAVKLHDPLQTPDHSAYPQQGRGVRGFH